MGPLLSTRKSRALNPAISDRHLSPQDCYLRAIAILTPTDTDTFPADPPRARRLWQSAVDHCGHVDSAFHLARLLEDGADGVDRDISAAMQLYRKAVDGGHVEAAFCLALLLKDGTDGVESDPPAAAALFEKAVAAGHFPAMDNLAVLLQQGARGVEEDVQRAMGLFRRAADGGYVNALVNLALAYEVGGNGVESDMSQAIGLYQQAADADDAVAITRLGLLYETGEGGLESDPLKAVRLYEKAAELGHAPAMFFLGLTYVSGAAGVEKNVPTAAKYYQQAADVGFGPAMNNLAILLKRGEDGLDKDLPAALRLFEKAIAADDITAMGNLAYMLINGDDGVQKDVPAAVELYKKAAAGGDSDAMNELGILLENGDQGVEMDVAEAVKFYRDAVECGNNEAMFNLALLLQNGFPGVVEKNAEESRKLYRRAADAGNIHAMNNLANCLNGDDGLEKDVQEAKRLYEKAAQGGNVVAMYNLAKLLENGNDGVERDLDAAVVMYRKAIDAGDLDAMNRFATLLEHGNDEIDKDLSAALGLYRKAADGGNTIAMVNLANLLIRGEEGIEKDPITALSFYQRAAENGNTDAVTCMGLLLEQGAQGIEQNMAEALSLYKKAAKAGNPFAIFNLARWNRTGVDGVSKDPPLALSQFEQAGQLGVAHALVHQGIMLRYGDEGIRRDIKSARECFERAYKAEGDAYSGILLSDLLLSDDMGEQRDPKRAVGLLEDVVQTSTFGFAFHELAVLYEKGDQGVPKNPVRAAELHAKAAAEGSYEFVGVTKTALRIITAGANYPKEVHEILRKGYSRPKTCLLLTLGGAGRGKTCTMNSIRGMDFVHDHEPTEMASLSKFILEPGRRGLEEDLIAELDFNDNSLQANASRLDYADGSEEGGGGTDQWTGESGTGALPSLDAARRVVEENATRPHADVIDRIRHPIVQHYIPRGFRGGVVQVWDMAGQSEYEMAHSLFITRANILVFVTDLKRVADESTRMGEIKLLCHWMQFAHILVPDPSRVSIVIVGTRKAECGEDASRVLRILKEGLRYQLGAPVYDSWIRERRGDKAVSKFIAIENEKAKADPKGSGLEDLERAVKVAADEVVKKRDKLPMRWLAFVDKLERDGRTFYSRSDIRDFSIGFPGFESDPDRREGDVLDGLRSFASTGRVILFELSEHEWFVFTDVSRIIDLVGKVTAPDERLQDFLSSEDICGLKQGRISRRALFTLWDGYSDDEKNVMLKLLCQFDLLMLLQDEPERGGGEVIGVPALLHSGWDDYKWGRAPGERDLPVTTEFAEAMPCGLIGRLMAFLHRTLGSAAPHAKLVRADAALLTVEDSGRVFVGFKGAERQLCWKFRSQDPVSLAWRCIRQLELLIKGPIRRVNLDRTHMIVQACVRSRQGCGEKSSVKVILSESWVSAETCEGLPSETVFCDNCQRPWRYSELTTVLFGPDDTPAVGPCGPLRPVMKPRKYNVFISHAGPDKLKLADPLWRALERLHLRAFLDKEELRISRDKGPLVMRRAMGEAHIGIFILSPDFAARKWPLIELRHFLWRHEHRKGKDRPVLLPIFYRLSLKECETVYDEKSPHRDLLEKWGFFVKERQAECSTEQAAAAMREVTEFSGVEVGRIGGGEALSSAAVMEEAVTRIIDFMRREGYIDKGQ